METIIVSLIVVLSPIFVAQFLRANAGAMFLAGCGGIVLLSTLDPVLVTTAGAVFPSNGESFVRILVIASTIIIAALLFKNSVDGVGIILNIILSGLLGLVLLLQLPNLTGLQALIDLIALEWWQTLALYDSALVVLGLGMSLMMVLNKKHHTKKSKKH